MRHRKAGKKFGRSPSHRRALFNNLLMSLVDHERIETTATKAHELKRLIDRLITLGKKGTLAARRQAAKSIKQPHLVQKLFDEIAPRFAERPGGYSRIMKLGQRKGDGAHVSIIELLPEDEKYVPRAKKQAAAEAAAPVTTKESFEDAAE